MKAIVSTNYDPKYIFFMPLLVKCWNKLGVEMLFLLPTTKEDKNVALFEFCREWCIKVRDSEKRIFFYFFEPPTANHEVTYTQVSRLFAAADIHIPDNEILILSDSDMLVFQLPPHDPNGAFSIFGADLVPPNQYPICYISATAAAWRETFVKGRRLQKCLDDELAHENCENMRGNLWGRDQEKCSEYIKPTNPVLYNRAYEGTQFATRRVDRDNAYWLEDLMRGDRNIVDAHLWRPGYTEENSEKIIRLLEIMYPEDSFHWIREYAAAFRNLL